MWSGETGIDRDLFVPWLTQSGALTESTFSWYLTGTDSVSYIDFGAPDPSIVGDGSGVVWLDLDPESPWWTNTVYGLRWGPDSDGAFEEEIEYDAISGITDTGSSCIIGPSRYVDDIYNRILSSVSVYRD